MKDKLPKDWPLPNEILLELGRISVLYQQLESYINFAISKLSGYSGSLDWRSAIVTAHANTKQRIEILETLCHELKEEYPQLSNYEKVIKSIKSVQSGRNKYAHNTISVNEETNHLELTSLRARGKLKPIHESVSLHNLKDLSARIHTTQLDLHQLITGVSYSQFGLMVLRTYFTA